MYRFYHEDHIPCLECANHIEPHGRENYEEISCDVCGQKYEVMIRERYGIGGSPSFNSLTWEDGRIIFDYLENPPMDLLKKGFDAHSMLSKIENRPSKLLPIVKDYHDSLFKRMQDVLGSDRSELQKEEREKIWYNPRGQGYNLSNIIEILPDGFSRNKEKTKSIIEKNSSLTNQLKWLRHKIEHVGIRVWPTPSFVHESHKKNPDDNSQQMLNREYLDRINHFVVELYSLVLEVDNRNTLDFEFENVDGLKI